MADLVSLKALQDRADFFAGASLSIATKKAYQTDWNAFERFCASHDLTSMPAQPSTICLFLTDEADNGFSVATITRRCTSISAVHENLGKLSPIKDASVSRVLRGIKRTKGAPPRSSKPILWTDLLSLIAQTDSLMIGVRDAAILGLGWATACRRSEIVALNIGDVEITDQGMIVLIRRSKTDQDGEGAKIAVPRNPYDFCPVKAVEKWLSRMSKTKLPHEKPLFPNIGCLGKGKWWWKPRGRLNGRMISIIVKQYCRLAGLSQNLYSAHSLRRGLATESASRGVPERIIKRQTRHRSLTVLRSYIEDGTIWEENPLPAIYSISGSSLSSNKNI